MFLSELLSLMKANRGMQVLTCNELVSVLEAAGCSVPLLRVVKLGEKWMNQPRLSAAFRPPPGFMEFVLCSSRDFVVWAKIKQRWLALCCICLPFCEGFEKEHWGLWLKIKLPLWAGAKAWTDLSLCVDTFSQTSRRMNRFYLQYKHGMWKQKLLLWTSQSFEW